MEQAMTLLGGARAFVRGFWTTLRHAGQPPITLNYPDVKRSVPPSFRGRHRLYRHEDGLERCIGCELCAAACPSGAIYVKAADNEPEHPVSTGERFAEIYEINMIRCIFCGYCEEACPVDAIKLGPEYELADFTREDFVYTKEMLLDPEKYAPRRQYHPDVDKARDVRIPDDLDLGEVYRRHRPLGAPAPSRSPVPAHSKPHHPSRPSTGSGRAGEPPEERRPLA
jgi:NADH-quinone oxidoreductase subunit I